MVSGGASLLIDSADIAAYYTSAPVSGVGVAIALRGNQTLDFTPLSGTSTIIDGSITDDASTGAGSGVAALVVSGAGAVYLGGADAVSGGVTVVSAFLELGAAGAAGTGPIAIEGGGTLQADSEAALGGASVTFAGSPGGALYLDYDSGFTNIVSGFAPSDTIVLLGAGASQVGTPALTSGNVLSAAGSVGFSVELDPWQNLSNYAFSISYENAPYWSGGVESGTVPAAVIGIEQLVFSAGTPAALGAAIATIEGDVAIAGDPTRTIALTQNITLSATAPALAPQGGVGLVISGYGRTITGPASSPAFSVTGSGATLDGVSIVDGGGGALNIRAGQTFTFADGSILGSAGDGGIVVSGATGTTDAPVPGTLVFVASAGQLDLIEDPIYGTGYPPGGHQGGRVVIEGQGEVELDAAASTFDGVLTVNGGHAIIAAAGAAGDAAVEINNGSLEITSAVGNSIGQVTINGTGALLQIDSGATVASVTGLLTEEIGVGPVGQGAVEFAGVAPAALTVSSSTSGTVIDGTTLDGVSVVVIRPTANGGSLVFVPQETFDESNSTAFNFDLSSVASGGANSASGATYTFDLPDETLDLTAPISIPAGGTVVLSGGASPSYMLDGDGLIPISQGTLVVEGENLSGLLPVPEGSATVTLDVPFLTLNAAQIVAATPYLSAIGYRQFIVSDSWADIMANAAALGQIGSYIQSFKVTDSSGGGEPTLTITGPQLAALGSANLSKIVTGINLLGVDFTLAQAEQSTAYVTQVSVEDTAANVAAWLQVESGSSYYNGGYTISDNATTSLSFSQAVRLESLTFEGLPFGNANGTPFTLDIVDSASNVFANLGQPYDTAPDTSTTLETDPHIVAITFTDTTASTFDLQWTGSAASYTAAEGVLAKATGLYNIVITQEVPIAQALAIGANPHVVSFTAAGTAGAVAATLDGLALENPASLSVVDAQGNPINTTPEGLVPAIDIDADVAARGAAILDKISAPVYATGTAAELAGDIDVLNDAANVGYLIVTDNAPVTLTATQYVTDQTAIGKLVDQSRELSYTYSPVANQGSGPNVNVISGVTDATGTHQYTGGNYTLYQYDGQYNLTIADTGQNFLANITGIEAGATTSAFAGARPNNWQINDVVFTDAPPPTLTVSPGELTADARAFSLIDSPFNLAVTGGGFAAGSTLDLLHFGWDGASRSVSYADGVLTVDSNGTADQIGLTGVAANTAFSLSSDGFGGTLVTGIPTSFTVSSESALNAAISEIDAGSNAAYTITLGGDIALSSGPLLAVNLASGGSLTISGGGHTISGGGTQQGFFVSAGTVTLDDLTISGALARGGAGGSGGDGGGGGAGLGGGLFVASGGSVTLDGVTFLDDAAQGGAGGAGGGLGGAGGGGLDGAGGGGSQDGGAGGFGGGGAAVGAGGAGAAPAGSGVAAVAVARPVPAVLAAARAASILAARSRAAVAAGSAPAAMSSCSRAAHC